MTDKKIEGQQTDQENTELSAEVLETIESLVETYKGVEEGQWTVELLDGLNPDDPQLGVLKQSLEALRGDLNDPENEWGSKIFAQLANWAVMESYPDIEQRGGRTFEVRVPLQKPRELIKLITSLEKPEGRRQSSREIKLARYDNIVHFAEKLKIPANKRRYSTRWVCSQILDKTWDQERDKDEQKKWEQLAAWALTRGRDELRNSQYIALQQFAKKHELIIDPRIGYNREKIFEELIDKIYTNKPLSDKAEHTGWTEDQFRQAQKELAGVSEWALKSQDGMDKRTYDAFRYWVDQLKPEGIKYTATFAATELLTPSLEKIRPLLKQQELVTKKGGMAGALLSSFAGGSEKLEAQNADARNWRVLAAWALPKLGQTIEEFLEV